MDVKRSCRAQDHALAVKLGVIERDILLNMMPQIRHRSGHRLAVKRFEDQYMGGFIMVDSEKWSLVDDHGFAQPVRFVFHSKVP